MVSIGANPTPQFGRNNPPLLTNGYPLRGGNPMLFKQKDSASTLARTD